MPIALVRDYGDGYVAYFTFLANGRWGVRVYRRDILFFNESRQDQRSAFLAAQRAVARRERESQGEMASLETSM